MEHPSSLGRFHFYQMLPIFFLLTLSFAQAQQVITRLDGSKISHQQAEAFAKEVLQNANVTGAQLAVLNQGKLVWSYAYGLRTKNPDNSMEVNTNTWAASITKGVFAAYVMTLVEKGEFSLDEPVSNQLPKPLNAYKPYEETASELVKDPNWKLVTPRILLSHSSGLFNFPFLEPDKKMHLHFRPGSKYWYSGDGINLVQFLIEQKKGQPIEVLMQQAIFAPASMPNTGMIFRKEFENNVADRFDKDGKFISQTKRFPARGAGSMTTSVEDLGHFVEALFSGRLMEKSTMQKMLKPAIKIRSLHQFPLKTDEPEGKEAKDLGIAYGMGWGLLTKTKFGPAFFKEGHGDGAQNYMICFERHQTCMIILTNSDNGELSYRPLMERILGNTITPWEWHGYTPALIEAARKNQ